VDSKEEGMKFFSWTKKGEGGREQGRFLPRPEGAKRLLSYRVANLQGMGARTSQEDSFAFANVLDVTKIREKGLLAIVADGMGGMRDGRLASEAAIASLCSAFNGLDYSADLAAQLKANLLGANEEVFRLLEGEGGSTVVVCLFYQEMLYFASVGDSFLYLKRNGQLIRMNREHNILHQRLLESIRSGSMGREDAEGDPEKAALTRFLGMEALDDVDYLRRPFALQDGDVYLLCSDGVGGVLTEECVLSCMCQAGPDEICAELERNIQKANKEQQDNYTALVIQCGY